MSDPQRARRLAERIKVIVASLLDTRIKDPRLGFVTVTDVRMTGDLQHASIFYTVFGDAEQQTNTQAALDSAKGMIRSEVGKGTGVRLTPSLEFIADALPDSAAALNDALARAAVADAQIVQQARGKNYAGDADPYVKPRVDE